MQPASIIIENKRTAKADGLGQAVIDNCESRGFASTIPAFNIARPNDQRNRAAAKHVTIQFDPDGGSGQYRCPGTSIPAIS